MLTFSFILGDIIPKSVMCIHSATKIIASGFYWPVRPRLTKLSLLGLRLLGFWDVGFRVLRDVRGAKS